MPEIEAGGFRRESRRLLLRRFLAGATGFWRKGGGRAAWLLTGALLALIILQLFFQYRINVWNRAIFDALEKRDSAAVFYQSTIFPLLAIAIVAVGVAGVYVRMTMQRRWRGWFAGHVVDRWLANGRYYQLNLVRGDHENPEYRIAEDLRAATDSPIDFAVGCCPPFCPLSVRRTGAAQRTFRGAGAGAIPGLGAERGILGSRAYAGRSVTMYSRARAK